MKKKNPSCEIMFRLDVGSSVHVAGVHVMQLRSKTPVENSDTGSVAHGAQMVRRPMPCSQVTRGMPRPRLSPSCIARWPPCCARRRGAGAVWPFQKEIRRSRRFRKTPFTAPSTQSQAASALLLGCLKWCMQYRRRERATASLYTTL